MSPVAEALIRWYRQGHRDLPWRRTTDAYRIWLAEIMLQQTRAQAAIPYYERFLERLPTVKALAAAAEDEVLALWSGLGYYTRARNLRRAAQRVVEAGGFPADYAGIRALPGVGDYTAAAVASIAFGLPHAVLDGNVLRVVARLENDASDISSPRTRERFHGLAQAWLAERQPGTFNQALMELGATVCVPRRPLCLQCPLRNLCAAAREGTAAQLPVKLRLTEPRRVDATVLVVRRGRQLLLRRRPEGSARMAGFWELPAANELPDAVPGRVVGGFRHSITNHRYVVTVATAGVARDWVCRPGFEWHTESRMASIPLSTIARKALILVSKQPAL